MPMSHQEGAKGRMAKSAGSSPKKGPKGVGGGLLMTDVGDLVVCGFKNTAQKASQQETFREKSRTTAGVSSVQAGPSAPAAGTVEKSVLQVTSFELFIMFFFLEAVGWFVFFSGGCIVEDVMRTGVC